MSQPDQVIRILLAVPVPPPFSGPEINGAMLLAHGLGPGFEWRHLDPGVRASNRAKGRVTAGALGALAALWLTTAWRSVRLRPHLLYIYLAQNRTGFARDAIVILTARFFGARVVAHVRGGNFANYFSHARRGERRLIRAVLRRLTRVVVVADRFRGQMEPLVPAGRVRVLYNGVDDRVLDAVAPVAGTRKPCSILFMGHLSVAKGFGDLLRALPAVLDRVPDARFVAAGEWLERERNIRFDEAGRPVASDRNLRAEWDALVARYGSRMMHVGVLTGARKIETLRGAAIFTLPSYSEGFPMAALEAMAAGAALVVTPVGALPEILADGTHATFVPVGDVTALGTALADLAADEGRRSRMGAENRRIVEQRFTFPEMRRGLEVILRDAASAS